MRIVIENIVVEYFLDSPNFGSRMVDVDDTPIVIDKLDRVTFAFHKEVTVGRKNFEFCEPGVDGFDWFGEDEYCGGLELRRWVK
nr:hypothetical protein [Tanacetum cinerariifolium]